MPLENSNIWWLTYLRITFDISLAILQLYLGAMQGNQQNIVLAIGPNPSLFGVDLQVDAIHRMHLESLGLHRHLLLSPNGNTIPSHWRMEDILNQLQPFANMGAPTLKSITFVLGILGITRAEHLWDQDNNS